MAATLVLLLTCTSVFAAQESSQERQAGEEIVALPGRTPGDLYALFVGVGKYKHAAVPSLNFPAKDAKDFAAVLETQKHLFKKINVKVLLDEQASKLELEKYLYYQLRKAGKNDTILIFLSGHGAIDPLRPGEFFFLAHEADPEFLEATCLNMSGLRFLKGLDCPRVVLIADSCHAGGFSKHGAKAAVPYNNFVRDFTASSGKVVISSSRPEEYSLEMPGIKNGVFTHFFLEALSGKGDQDSDCVVTINEAYNYVYSQTKDATKGAQHPQFEGTVEGLFPLAMVASLDKRPPISAGHVPRAATVLELQTEPGGADVFIDNRLMGRTAEDGFLHVKYLPLDTAIAVRIKKDGWLEKVVGPFYFTGAQPQVRSGLIKLQAAIASLQITTEPGEVVVKVNGQVSGTTDKKGSLTIDGLKVTVPLQVEFEAKGHKRENMTIMLPAESAGSVFKYAGKIVLSREAQLAEGKGAASRESVEKKAESDVQEDSGSTTAPPRAPFTTGEYWGPGWGRKGRDQSELQNR
jgi:hypothetical protein